MTKPWGGRAWSFLPNVGHLLGHVCSTAPSWDGGDILGQRLSLSSPASPHFRPPCSALLSYMSALLLCSMKAFFAVLLHSYSTQQNSWASISASIPREPNQKMFNNWNLGPGKWVPTESELIWYHFLLLSLIKSSTLFPCTLNNQHFTHSFQDVSHCLYWMCFHIIVHVESRQICCENTFVRCIFTMLP